MGRSFGIVESKVTESAYFFSKLEESLNERGPFYDANFILSAFLSSTRSITFTLQASLSDLEGFNDWYSKHQKKLKEDKLARYFLEARNLSQKVGHYPIGGGGSRKNEKGEWVNHTWFQQFGVSLDYVPDEDVLVCCRKYLILLLEVVLDCYKVFGRHIDAEQFFTLETMILLNKTIEDMEEQAGYPRGHTATPGVSVEERIKLLQYDAPKPSSSFEEVLIVYLGVNRFGEPIEITK